jgi:hypothetical protein
LSIINYNEVEWKWKCELKEAVLRTKKFEKFVAAKSGMKGIESLF